jgi:hypothetical protein
MNEIWYNNKNAFSGISYLPFVTVNRESDGWWQAIDTFSLEGEIIGCGSDFSGMLIKQSNLINNFSQNFKNFQIKEDNNILFSADSVVVREIKFEESNYAYILPYKIDLEVFDPFSFSGQYYVTRPVDEFKIEEDGDGIVKIVHEISADGITNNNSAIYNAKNWVYSRTGLNNFVKPLFISMHSYSNPTLISMSETVDRLGGKYSVVENYLFDQKNIINGTIRYSNVINKTNDNFTTVDINGQIYGGLGKNLQYLRNQYNQLNLWNLAFDVYKKVTKNNDLNSFYLTSGVTEDIQRNTLSFNITFNNDNSPIINVNSTASYVLGSDIDSSEDVASLASEITCRVGNQEGRYAKALDYFNNNFNAIDEFNRNMQDFNNNDYRLTYFKLKEDSVTHNEAAGKITYKCSWNINKINENIPCYIKTINYTINKSYSLQQYEYKQPLCKDWNAYGTHMQPISIQIQGDATFEKNYYNETLNFIENMANGYKLFYTTAKSINKDLNNNRLSFSYNFTD